MECKFVSGCIAATLGPELIDTLWNVNFADGSVHGHSPLWINRYIMECKLFKTGGGKLRERRINRYIMECK